MVEIVQPQWRLKDRLCPCYCGGEGFLIFMSCPSCGYTLLKCDEVGTVFPNIHNLDNKQLISSATAPTKVCPGCETVSLAHFRNATSAEVRVSGFKPGEYE